MLIIIVISILYVQYQTSSNLIYELITYNIIFYAWSLDIYHCKCCSIINCKQMPSTSIKECLFYLLSGDSINMKRNGKCWTMTVDNHVYNVAWLLKNYVRKFMTAYQPFVPLQKSLRKFLKMLLKLTLMKVSPGSVNTLRLD